MGRAAVRRAPDGRWYTKQQFRLFFGGLDEWNAACPVAGCGDAGMGPTEAPLACVAVEESRRRHSVRRRRVVPDSPLFKQLLTIQRDMQSFHAVADASKMRIKRWQSTKRFQRSLCQRRDEASATLYLASGTDPGTTDYVWTFFL
jgi:hypothetical protein